MNTYTFDEITAKIIARGSKASKIEWLTKEAGFNPHDAEATYTFIMRVTPRPEATRRERRQAREALFEVMHFTVGCELECANVNTEAIRRECASRGISMVGDRGDYNHTDSTCHYKFVHDSSIHNNGGDVYGPCEIVSPVLNNLESLKTVCDIINAAGAHANSSCGFHVHFGASEFTHQQWRRIVINYANIEGIIDSFMAPSRRANNSCWCKSMKSSANYLRDNITYSFEDVRRAIGTRYAKVNLDAFSRHSTIEFRQHAGTTNYSKIENWINFLAAFLTWSLRHEEYLDATTIDELPFLNAEQKAFFKGRKEYFDSRA